MAEQKDMGSPYLTETPKVQLLNNHIKKKKKVGIDEKKIPYILRQRNLERC